MGHLFSGPRTPPELKTYRLLDQFVAVLGSTKTTFWPLIESSGAEVWSYKENAHAFSYKENAHAFTMTDAGTDGFHPVTHPGLVQSYHFDKDNDQHGAGVDHADFSFADGGTDDPFSIGAFVLQDTQGADAAILAKYDVAGTDREWKFAVGAANKAYLELYDESLDDTVTATSGTALTLNTWHFVVITYGGEGGTPGKAGMSFVTYLDGADDSAVITDGGGNVYEDMEAGATPIMLGAADDTAAPTVEFNGRLALPFICGSLLTPANVVTLRGIGRQLLGQ
jgi:hypothetical protein